MEGMIGKMTNNRLVCVLGELNEEYFGGKKKLPKIRFMKTKSKKIFGRYSPELKIIEINPVILENERILRYVIWHEFCHSIIKRRIGKKKYVKHHTKRFYELERRYSDIKIAQIEYLTFVKRYWIKVGYLKKEE